ncbi:MAG: T9SS type A sorting domain-containing protein [Flavobacterium sp.]|uniref:T9SS type A sorting domain-containing protein n=1 Tax=Flavobacterium sp. TaxID=239 RepID=UPI0025B7CFE0|nr:T9SS type A sorting domain-containing protein [Flavobacterium sp.]MCK6607513.1 T9SS type A sorting domain-containing protein [Flavobacterium sp.]
MKKLYTLILFSISLFSFAQGNINFDDAAKWTQGAGGTIPFTTYSDHSYTDGVFSAVGASVVRNTTAAQDGVAGANGTYAFRLNQTGTTSLTITISSGGVGNFSFATRRWDNTPATNYTVEYSTDNGSNWTTSSTIDASVTNDSNWKTVNGVINSTNANIQIRIKSNGTTERLLVDDFIWTAPSSSPTLVVSSPTNGTLYNPSTTSVNINFATSNFVIATIGNGDGHLNYTINSGPVLSKFDNTAIALTSLTPGTYNLTLELVDDTNAPLSPAVTATVSFTIQSYTVVPNLNALRLDVLNNGIGGYYHVTGEAIVTYTRPANRNQKYIQDATAAILIDDNSGVITNSFAIGDGITNLKGQTTYFNGVLQIVPFENNTPSSNGNTITPQLVTINDINASIEQYESELVKINNVTFADGNGSNTFTVNTNYSISDGNTMNFRTLFAEVDYVTTPNVIPSTPYSIVVLVAKNVTTPQVVARSFSDVTLSSSSFNAIEGLTMYPNPLKGNTLYLTSTANADMSVQIFDVLGKEVVKSNVINNAVNVSGLNAGIYIVKVTEEGKTATRKLVIQ